MALTVLTVTIAEGELLSNAADLGLAKIVAIITPTGWTPAPVTLQASANNEDFYDVFDGINGEELAFNIAAGSFWSLVDPTAINARAVKFRSGMSNDPVPQEAAREIKVVVEGSTSLP